MSLFLTGLAVKSEGITALNSLLELTRYPVFGPHLALPSLLNKKSLQTFVRSIA